jgi:hypothetical protein
MYLIKQHCPGQPNNGFSHILIKWHIIDTLTAVSFEILIKKYILERLTLVLTRFFI